MADDIELVYQLTGYPAETEWLEFKSNNSDPSQIGRNISALANSAALHEREHAYKIWGVADATHELTGTDFDPDTAKASSNQGLKIWLSVKLSRNADYRFKTIRHDGKRFVVLQVEAAIGQPVLFEGKAYVREGESTTALKGGSAKERKLWQRLQQGDTERRAAREDVPADEVPLLLRTDVYFQKLGVPEPTTLDGTLMALSEQDLIRPQDDGRYTITNLGALLVGQSLRTFPGLKKRAIRMVRYDGEGSFGIIDDRVYDMGYAMALEGVANDIMRLTPAGEKTRNIQRVVDRLYPERAVRELLSNMAIHQDISDVTSGPRVNLYSNRIEFANPGASLVSVERVLNAQPKTRNMALVEVMREMDLCEEGGTGWDIAVAACEAMHLAAPKMTSDEETGTTVTLYSERAYPRLSKSERKAAVYWHACLMYAQGKAMANQSLRARFGLDNSKKNVVAMSRLIRDCVEDGSIKEVDEDAGAKYKRYVPHWA